MSDAGAGPSNTWATLLKSARTAKGWSQDDLAAEADVARMTIIRWEGGAAKVDLDALIRVVKALGLPLSAAVGAFDPDAEHVPLPPPLPRPLAELADCYSDMNDRDRADLLQRVEWIVEWARARMATTGQAPQRRGRRVG